MTSPVPAESSFFTPHVGKGTGLGLSTVYGIVEQSGGFVWVTSEPTRGTTFNIYLPLVDAPIDPPAQPDPQTTPRRGTETILVVEDDAALLRLLEQTLEEEGYTALAARSPTEALDIWQQRQEDIDLVLTDTVMPETSGLDLGRKLLASQPHVKLLVMSGYSQHLLDNTERQELGAGFLQKPFSTTTLSRTLRELLDTALTDTPGDDPD